ncbi:hypothetical protein DDE20_10920 [Pararhodobacter oceanensis]|uniref:SnoaL-like domain-containing protein n=2 Tax=Pararhodobacter oceanensis TaxID=2172121 RepID=A0A2T8HTI3_9RHOB|nr:hypothetical protein DDE20_10920 [Pararhodobacter oceanensis]
MGARSIGSGDGETLRRASETDLNTTETIMPDADSHEAYFRSVLTELYAGNFEPFNAAIADDYICHTPGRSSIAGDYHGTEQAEVKRPKMRALTAGSFKVRKLGDICISGDWAMVPVVVSAEAGDTKLETPAFGIWRFRGDKIVEHWEMNFDQYGFDAFVAAAEAQGR